MEKANRLLQLFYQRYHQDHQKNKLKQRKETIIIRSLIVNMINKWRMIKKDN